MNPLQQFAEAVGFSAELTATIIITGIGLFGVAVLFTLAWTGRRPAPVTKPAAVDEDLELIENQVRHAVARLSALGVLADGTYLPVIRQHTFRVTEVELVRVDDLARVRTTADLPGGWTA